MISLRRSAGGVDLVQGQLALDGAFVGEVGDLVHADELVQLLRDLLVGHVVGLHDGRDARHGGVFRGAHGQRLDVEAAPRDEARHARQHAGLVLHQDGQDVFHSAPPLPAVFVFGFRHVRAHGAPDGHVDGADDVVAAPCRAPPWSNTFRPREMATSRRQGALRRQHACERALNVLGPLHAFGLPAVARRPASRSRGWRRAAWTSSALRRSRCCHWCTMPRHRLSMTSTFTGTRLMAAVAISWLFIWNDPSPATHTTWSCPGTRWPRRRPPGSRSPWCPARPTR